MTSQDVANKSATSWQQVVVMEFGKRHDTTDTTDFCPRQLVTDLLWICYGESGVMDFGLITVNDLSVVLDNQLSTSRPRINCQRFLTKASRTLE